MVVIYILRKNAELQARSDVNGGVLFPFLLLNTFCNMSNNSSSSIMKPFIFHLCISMSEYFTGIKRQNRYIIIPQKRLKVQRAVHECCYGQKTAKMLSESSHQLSSILIVEDHGSFPLYLVNKKGVNHAWCNEKVIYL